MAWRYRMPERVKELDRLVAEHAVHHPDDPLLTVERGELHLFRGQFAQAEQQFRLAEGKVQNPYLPRSGLIRARIKLGKTADLYDKLGPAHKASTISPISALPSRRAGSWKSSSPPIARLTRTRGGSRCGTSSSG